MKILYVADERGAAQLAAKALRDIAPGVKLSWARRLSTALHWLDDNLDVTALVVEAEVESQSCAAFVGQVRGRGLSAPIVVVAPEQMGTPLEAISAGADDYIPNNQSLLANLPAVVRRALQQQATARPTREPVRLLYLGDAALARRCFENPGWSIEIDEIVPGSNGTFQPIPPEFSAEDFPQPFDIVFVEHDHPRVDAFAILRDFAARGLHVPVILVVEWDEKAAVKALKLGAKDCVKKSADSFRALLFKLDRLFAQSTLRREQAEPRVAERLRESEGRFQQPSSTSAHPVRRSKRN